MCRGTFENLASGRGWDPPEEIEGGSGYSIVQGRKRTQLLLFQGLDVL